MLPDIQEALRQLIYEHGHIDPREVDVAFEAPINDWMERLIRPTVSFYLFDLRENAKLRQTDFSTTRSKGQSERRMTPRRVDLRYMVTALSSVPVDEGRLLWRVMATLLKYTELPKDVLPEAMRDLDPPIIAKLPAEDDNLPSALDIWGGLGVRPRPALIYSVTAPMDLDMVITAPLVLTRTLRYSNIQEPQTPPDQKRNIGGVVRDKHGAPLVGITVAMEGSAADGSRTNDQGWFSLTNVPTGEVKLRVSQMDKKQKTITITVPGDAYDVVLD